MTICRRRPRHPEGQRDIMMNAWPGALGVTFGFLIVVSVLLWFLIGSRGRWTAKFLLIFATVWYASAMYFSIHNFTGWPSGQDLPPDSQILAVRVQEPNAKEDHPGAIYLWAERAPADNGIKTLAALLHPRNAFTYRGQKDPRAFKLPYDREMHRELMEAQERMQGIPGAKIRVKNRIGHPAPDRQGDIPESPMTDLRFEIVTPVRLPSKEQR